MDGSGVCESAGLGGIDCTDGAVDGRSATPVDRAKPCRSLAKRAEALVVEEFRSLGVEKIKVSYHRW